MRQGKKPEIMAFLLNRWSLCTLVNHTLSGTAYATATFLPKRSRCYRNNKTQNGPFTFITNSRLVSFFFFLPARRLVTRKAWEEIKAATMFMMPSNNHSTRSKKKEQPKDFGAIKKAA